MHCSWVHFVREPQGFQNTRTLFFERVTAVTEYYGVLERVVQPKEKSYEVGAFRDEASCFLGVSSYVNDTFWKNGMVFQSLFQTPKHARRLHTKKPLFFITINGNAMTKKYCIRHHTSP